MALIRIDGTTFPLVGGDDVTYGEIAKLETHFGRSIDELNRLKVTKFLVNVWISAKRAGFGDKFSLEHLEDAKSIEVLNDDGTPARTNDDGDSVPEGTGRTPTSGDPAIPLEAEVVSDDEVRELDTDGGPST